MAHCSDLTDHSDVYNMRAGAMCPLEDSLAKWLHTWAGVIADTDLCLDAPNLANPIARRGRPQVPSSPVETH
jgi:hypothetical protein